MTAAQAPVNKRIDVQTAAKRLLFVALAALTLVTVYVHEAYVFRPSAPQWAHLAPFRQWLLPHVLTGALALVLGPLQFSNSLRMRSLRFHRCIGRTYAASVLVSSPLAIYIILVFEQPSARWVMGAMAVLWLMTTTWGWVAALRHNIQQHKLWMARSYCFTFTFTLTRFALDVVWPGMDGQAVTNYYWVLNILCLIAPDLLLRGKVGKIA